MGISSLLNVSGKFLPRNTWSEEQKYKYQLNARVRHILIYALSKEEIAKVHAMLSAKEMWETLALSMKDLIR